MLCIFFYCSVKVDCYNRGLGTCLALDASQTKIQELQNAHRKTTNTLQELQNAHQRTINALWNAEDRVEELENHEVESISTLHRQIRKLRCNRKSSSKKSEKLITLQLT
ncbi:unnamed protein product [Rhizophagus irregularis]|nr:unnamed protein product [Rhizophagus irregularis]